MGKKEIFDILKSIHKFAKRHKKEEGKTGERRRRKKRGNHKLRKKIAVVFSKS